MLTPWSRHETGALHKRKAPVARDLPAGGSGSGAMDGFGQGPCRRLGHLSPARRHPHRVADLVRFLEAFSMLDLADGTTSPAYTSPQFPRGRGA